jgi:hypothetical protein
MVGTLAIFFAVACDNDGYIDDIKSVDPGDDATAPVVTIGNPNIDKIVIPFPLESTDINFQFEVIDDIEISEIVLLLDGTEIASYDNFLDFRRFVNSLPYEDLAVGDHTVQVTATDLSGKSTSASHDFEVGYYDAKYDGEIFYMPFEAGSFAEHISRTFPTVEGTPGFSAGKIGQAYAGSTDEFLTFPTTSLTNNEFSATLWYQLNSTPDRSGILTIGPPDPNLPATPNNRMNGFRLFREATGNGQTFKLNVGNGTADNWFDGGAAASVNPNTTDWIHLAFTISDTKCVVYVNGQVASQGAFAGVDWTDCDILSIASGEPRFMEWGHLSDRSLYDELRIFNKELSQEEVQAVMNGN